MKLIRSYFGNVEEPETVVWDSEGGREEDISSTKRQLYQCVKAVEFLLIQNLHQPLSMALILDTHRIMMEHSYSYEGFPKERVATQVGQFRTTEVGAGMFYLFPPAQSITGGIRNLIVDYNDDSVVKHPIEKATLLFYELITIHPFSNGNGRLCRLFLVWSLLQSGFPFPFSFSSGHSKRRQHYLHAINSARTADDGVVHELNLLALVSLERTIANFGTNCRIVSYSVNEEVSNYLLLLIRN